MRTILRMMSTTGWQRYYSWPMLLVVAFTTMAATPAPDAPPDGGGGIGLALWHCFLFGLLGIVMVVIGFKFFDCLIRKIDVEAEVAKGNVAAAILGAAVVLGISIIVAAAIH